MRLGHQHGGTDAPECTTCRPSIEELIERSSLGTPAAKALRESVPDDVARSIVQRANEIAAGCICNAGPLGWRYRKGAGPDPARCPVHGAPTPSRGDETTPGVGRGGGEGAE